MEPTVSTELQTDPQAPPMPTLAQQSRIVTCTRCRRTVCSACGRVVAGHKAPDAEEMAARTRHLRNIYLLLGYQLLVITPTVLIIALVPHLYAANRTGMFMLLAAILVVATLLEMDRRPSHPSDIILLTFSSALLGSLASSTASLHTVTEIWQAAVGTAIIYVSLVFYVHQKKRNLACLIDCLYVGLGTLTVLGIMWLISPWNNGKLVLSYLCTVLTCMITAYEIHVERWFPLREQRSAILRSATLAMDLFFLGCSVLAMRHLAFP
ncbi:membrane protein A35 [Aotine betaherpesvirus 1]|uniref:Membrane protein A35 n=1 Tax=Aotine betaherpesvirus 1 TaxID=50290 RepID=G8XUL3_9BETA|nr:membrane protein A35 [Aotine betaherpesvirus 1]AEV80855.1 membrane protein A35 [Aotine betaherpesvirus 1]